MARAGIGLSVSTNGFPEAEQFMSGAPERLDRAAYAATERSVRLMEDAAASAIEEIAGGVYWDINSQVQRLPHGALGRVVTPPSRPHTIEPKGPYPLRFQIGGRWVSTYHVDHPGSNPVNWPDRLGGFATAAERIYADEVDDALGRTRG